MSAPPKRMAPAGYGTEAGAGISVAAEIRSLKYNETPDAASVKARVQLDDICTFLPGITEAEHMLRAKIRSMRNCAGSMMESTDSDTARWLAWFCSEWATAYVYAGVDDNTLSEVGRFCNRLMVTAMQAEAIEDRSR